MAYLDDEALARELNRQRLLSGQTPIGFGEQSIASIQPMVQGLRMPERPAPPPLQVQPGGMRSGVSAPQPWRDDSGLAQALSGILGGGGGGIRDFLKRLQDARAVPSGSVVRGTDLPPPPGTTAAPPRAPSGPPGATGGPSPQQLIPGLQPRIDARQHPPGAPAAAAYIQEKTPGPAVRGVEKPPPQAAAPPAERQAGLSQILADQRRDYAAQIDANPQLKEKFAAIMLAEEGGDADARTALAESALNRGVATNNPQLDRVLDPRYYQPMHDGSGNYEKALQRIRNDPKLRAQIYSDMDRASHQGSNVSNLATDNASGQVAANSSTNQTKTHVAANGESFFVKNVRPDVHGAGHVKRVKDWHSNTTAALVDEKPAPAQPTRVASADSAVPAGAVPAAPGSPAPATPATPPASPQAPAEPPGWLKDTIGNYLAEKGVPPGHAGTVGTPTAAPAAPAEPAAPPTAEDMQTKARDLLATQPERLATTGTPIGQTAVDPRQTAAVPQGEQPPAPQQIGQVPKGNQPAGSLPPPQSSRLVAGQNVDPAGYELARRDANQRMLSPERMTTAAAIGGAAPAMTPEIGKAVLGAINAEGAEVPPTPQIRVPEAQPVLPPDVPPPAPGAPGGAQLGPQSWSLQQNLPQMAIDASQGNSLALMPFAPPPPVQVADMSTPLIQQQAIGSLWEPPIPWNMMSDWGWGGTGLGAGSGFDFGGGGGFDMGGGSGMSFWGSTFGG